MHKRALAAFATALLSACAGAFTPQRDELKIAVQEFNDGMRWGKLEQTAMHLPVERRQAFSERFAGLEDELEIMDYDVQRVEFDRQKDTAAVRVDISWSLKRRGIVERTVLEENFEHGHGTWLMTRARRIKGSPLPILDDPPSTGGTAPAPTPAAGAPAQ